MGNKCNQECSHCHIGASPRGNKNMNYDTVKKIVGKLIQSDVKNIEFTGGAPELNRNLRFFIEKLGCHNKDLTVRTNLTVLDSPRHSFYFKLFKKYNVKLIGSFPSMFPDTTDKQRGTGTFKKSIKVLRKLNKLGYGTDGCSLSLVYNPAGDFLPPDQFQLEEEYKKMLKERFGISFNNLLTITNSPIKRFRESLRKEGRLESYMRLLKERFNSETLKNIMCRRLLSVDYAGNLYDCDFNLALGKKLIGYEDLKFWDVDFSNFYPSIHCDEHCYACTVNQGSSCHGILVKNEEFTVKEQVKKYYGEVLKRSQDLKTDACCTVDTPPEHIKKGLALINDEIKMKYYGCGSPIPLSVKGLSSLDVGCGTGRDVYILSYLIGEKGKAYGIDMTKEQIDVAQKYKKEQSQRFGHKRSNVDFIFDCMENIKEHFKKESLDIVISNCVINLAEDKEVVLRQIYNVLKWSGEFYFSDIYADRRTPDEIKKNPILYGECLGGALYYRDFERIARRAGFTDPRIISKREISITKPEIRKLVQNVKFYSITYRLWKIRDLDDACEDYGHVAIYKGSIPESPSEFVLDAFHVFDKNKPERVCGNTALMLSRTRFKKHFKIYGSFREHFGEFKICSNTGLDNVSNSNSGSCCV